MVMTTRSGVKKQNETSGQPKSVTAQETVANDDDDDSSDDEVIPQPKSVTAQETVANDDNSSDDEGKPQAMVTNDGRKVKHHKLLGIQLNMIPGGVYLHCICEHVRRVEQAWVGKVPTEFTKFGESTGFVDQLQDCPDKLFRRTNSFRKMKIHIKKCTSREKGGRAEEKDLPPMFRRTYNNRPIRSKRMKPLNEF
jgi:hypothetical protein